MPIRHNREPQRPGSAPRGADVRSRLRERRRACSRWTTVLLLAVLALAALQAPSAQARATHERSPEEEAALVAGKEAAQAEHAELAATRKAELAAERNAARNAALAEKKAAKNVKQSQRSVQNGSRPREHGGVTVSCTQVNWKFWKFPDGSNTVTHVVTVKNIETGERLKFRGSLTFDGEEGETVTSFNLPPGSYKIDSWAKWKGNGIRGGFDILGSVTCGPTPGFSIEKLQRLDGKGTFTKSTLAGEVGETVEYEILLDNTGNVPLTFEALTDNNCDEDTLSGGPGPGPLAPGASATYTCSHVLSAGDRAAGSHSNAARSTGAPPEGDGFPITHISNTVIVTVANPAPAFTLEKLQRIASSGSFTTSTLGGQVGQTVEYEVIAKNTGNLSLTLGELSDSQCDPGTIAGGPAGGTLASGASATYTCSHVLNAADLAAGSYSNMATLTATPPDGAGAPITQTSNTVVTTVSAAPPSGGGGSPPPGGNTGVLGASVTQPPETGVLASLLSSAPGLKAPQGCVRDRFQVSVKSAAVHSVSFYLDGHKLKTLTSKNAHKGLLSIQIDPAKWKVGPHRLVAKITMNTPVSGKAVKASRTARLVRCRAALLTPKFTG